MSAIKNVTVTGVSGDFGSVLLAKLLSSGLFNVRILRREGSSATFPDVPASAVVDVDFSSVEALKAALQGQDAVVSAVGPAGLLSQIPLAEAAAAVGVKRFIPSEYGCDLEIPAVRELPVFGHKVQVEDAVAKIAQTTSLTYTLLYNAAFFDWGLRENFLVDFSQFKPRIYDGGEALFSVNTLDSVANAVVAILTHLEETKNRSVRIEDAKLSQSRILALAKEVAPEKPWEVEPVKLDDALAAAYARLGEGKFDHQVIIPMLHKALLDPALGSNFTKVDNELLGLKTLTDEEAAQIVKDHVKSIVS